MDISRMQKIAITGKANAGKNTTAMLIGETFGEQTQYKLLAFADPIKEMLLQMFPWAARKCLYGPSKLRNNIIPDALDKNGKPLTYRQVLIDLGRQGREYQEDHWIKVFNYRVKYMLPTSSKTAIIVTDVRYRNEFDYLKENGYYQIKILRNSDIVINDSSETNQDQIKNEEFDFILDNNGSLNDLNGNIKKIVSQIRGV
jgi:hypothetical protein